MLAMSFYLGMAAASASASAKRTCLRASAGLLYRITGGSGQFFREYRCSPFSYDASTSRDAAFAKIRARVLGTGLAEKVIGARP